jgi:hypothetical protein
MKLLRRFWHCCHSLPVLKCGCAGHRRDCTTHTMKHCIVLSALVLAASLAHATDKAPTAQQNLMATCNTEATGKKGDERKDFMKSCLSDGKKRQQERMKLCNADATGKKGDERTAFMSECLKK